MSATIIRTPPAAVYSTERLVANLGALARRDAELAERLRWPVESEHVVFEPDGRLLYVMHRDACSLAIAEPPAGLDARRALLLGIGEGDLVETALRSSDQRELLCWERDPWLMRLDLMRHDRRPELASGRLRLLLGPDLLELRGFGGAVVPHPLLSSPYRLEIESFLAKPRAKRALLCVGKLFVQQVADALAARGFELWSLDVARQATEELARTVRRFDPELIVSINHSPGLPEFCHEHRRRLVVWEVDPTQYATPPCTSPTRHTWIWTHRRRHVERYRAAGFEQVEYLPLAADPEVRRPLTAWEDDARDAPSAPISFVGNSLVSGLPRFQAQFLALHAAWRGVSPAANADGAELLKLLLERQRADYGRFLVPELLATEAPGFREAVLADGQAPDPAILVGELSGAEKRLSTVAHLGTRGIRVWGDAGWNNVAARGVEPMGSAGHGAELTRIYNGSRVNLDIGRVYQPDIVTMRVFDVLACGAFVLAEHTAALGELFEVGTEVDSYRSLAELTEKVDHYLAHPEAASEIAERGRGRVLAEHTIAHRVDRMLAAL